MLKLSMLLVALLVAVAHADTADFEAAAESGFEPYAAKCILTDACFNGRRYFFENKTKRKQGDALNYCADIGMSLVSVESCDENDFIVNFIKEMKCTDQHFWTSGYQSGDHDWTWETTGKEVHYSNWKAGEPNYEHNKENCLQYQHDFLQWNDEKCDTKSFYICESDESC